MLGALICCGDEEEEFAVGTGLTHESRQQYWEIREDLIGKYAHVEYQHITPGRGVPRFPVLMTVTELYR